MTTYRAAVLEARGSLLQLKDFPMPTAVAGSAIIKILATQISPNTRRVFSGEMALPLTTPIIPSAGAVGRVHEVGPDAVRLKPGQLVMYDFSIAARDNPDVHVLQGYANFNDDLYRHWQHGTYAGYARVPLEKCWLLNEQRLVQELGYTYGDLIYMATIAIAYAGIQTIDVRPGDTVIVAPATGYFGGSAVHAAIACGARVIAAGRNEAVLEKLKNTFGSTGRITSVKLTGDAELDTKALVEASGSTEGADRFVDFSPPRAAGTTHIEACIKALRPRAKISLTGLMWTNVAIPYADVMLKNLSIHGSYMFDSENGQQVVKLAESGLLKLGPGDQSGVEVHSFKLEDVREAVDKAEEVQGFGAMVVVEP